MVKIQLYFDVFREAWGKRIESFPSFGVGMQKDGTVNLPTVLQLLQRTKQDCTGNCDGHTANTVVHYLPGGVYSTQSLFLFFPFFK